MTALQKATRTTVKSYFTTSNITFVDLIDRLNCKPVALLIESTLYGVGNRGRVDLPFRKQCSGA